ncbi:MAG TPA: MFS transporter, partial [Acidimicrobiales bacterium]|nr:MFS transporter [Acidimicrobiales bacterium]
AAGVGSAGDGATAGGGPPRPRVLSRPVLGVLLLAVAGQMPTGLYDALWSRLLTDRGADPFLIGLSLTIFGIPFVLLAPLGGRVAARRSPLVWAAFSLVLAAGFMASYGFVRSPVVITILGTFEACAQAVVVPGGYAATSLVFPDRWAATGQGWFSGAGTASAGVAAVAGAPVYAAAGPGVVFAGGAGVSALFALASVGVAGGLAGRRRPEPAPGGPGRAPVPVSDALPAHVPGNASETVTE